MSYNFNYMLNLIFYTELEVVLILILQITLIMSE